MASAGQKSKRYRDKLRSDPEKWKDYRSKQSAACRDRRKVLKLTETEAMKMLRREQERERKRKYRDSKKKLTVKLNLKRHANTGE